MSKTIFAALITTLLAAALVWVSAYFKLPFWYCLLSSALFFAAPQSNLLGLVITLFTALLGVAFGVIYLKVSPYIPHFQYQMEAIVGVVIFFLFIITQHPYLKYFACSLITLSLLILENGNWIFICQAMVIGIVFGFVAKSMSLLIGGKNLN